MNQHERCKTLMNYMNDLKTLVMDYAQLDESSLLSFYMGLYIATDIMVQILLLDLGYELTNEGFVKGNSKNQNDMPAGNFAEAHHLFLSGCIQDINSIRIIRNKIAHGKPEMLETIDEKNEIINQMIHSFDKFEFWFLDQLNYMQSIDDADRIHLINRKFSVVEWIYGKNQYETNAVNLDQIAAILKQINDHVDSVEKIEKQIESGNNQIIEKLDSLSKEISSLSENIREYQHKVSEKLKFTTDAEEIEQLMAEFSDQCTEKIISKIEEKYSREMYKVESQKIILSIGIEAWNKLEERSQVFLTTSKVMFNQMLSLDNQVDYSGVCLLVTKAIEVEMKKRFQTWFFEYLKEKFPGENQFENYPTAFLIHNKKDRPILKKDFTLGSVAFVLCYKENSYDSEEKKANNQKQLIEYSKTKLFSKKNDEEIKKILNYYAEEIELIKNKFRNPASHTNELKKVNAEECFDLVLDVEKILKVMLDSFDF